MTSTSNISDVTFSLSADASVALDAFLQEVITTANSTEPCDRELIAHGVRQLYAAAGLEAPVIVWCQNPVQLPLMPLVIEAKLLPIKRDLIQRFLGTEIFDALSNQLNVDCNDPAICRHETLIRNQHSDTLRQKVTRQIDLLENFHNVFVSSVQNKLSLSYALSIVCQAHTEINNRLTMSLEDALNPNIRVLNRRTADELSDVLLLEDRFDWQVNESRRGSMFFMTESLASPFDTNLLRQHAGLARALWTGQTLLVDEASPSEHAEDAKDLLPVARDMLINYFSTLHACSMLTVLARFSFARYLNPDIFRKQDEVMLQMWWQLATGASAYLCLDSVCFVSGRPVKLSVDANDRWHHDLEPAVQFSGNFHIYAVHGVNIPAELIEHPELITVARIEQEENAEIRRVLLDRYGLGRYILDSGAEVIDHSEYGTLYRREIVLPEQHFLENLISSDQVTEDTRRTRRMRRDREPLVMVKVINSTPERDGSFREYFLRVPPTIESARQAIAWTFNMEEKQYSPIEES